MVLGQQIRREDDRLVSVGGSIAIVSALAEEMRPLARRLVDSERCRVEGIEARRGRLSGRDVCLAVTGEGSGPATATLGALLSNSSVEALLGIGVAGGLTEDLGAGDLVLSRSVVGPDRATLQPPEWEWSDQARRIEGLPGGTVATVQKIVLAPREKRRLAARLKLETCSVVDLESAAWAAAAAGRGLPWLVLRAVSDAWDDALPLDFERFRSADGRVSRPRILAHALVRPRLWGELVRLRRRVDSCAAALADAAEALLAW